MGAELVGVPGAPLEDGEHSAAVDGEEVLERWSGGRLQSRSFRRLDGVPAGSAQVRVFYTGLTESTLSVLVAAGLLLAWPIWQWLPEVGHGGEIDWAGQVLVSLVDGFTLSYLMVCGASQLVAGRSARRTTRHPLP